MPTFSAMNWGGLVVPVTQDVEVEGDHGVLDQQPDAVEYEEDHAFPGDAGAFPVPERPVPVGDVGDAVAMMVAMVVAVAGPMPNVLCRRALPPW